VRTLVAVQDQGIDFVTFMLDAPIPRPMMLGDDNDFPVQVALLSRNVVFESISNDVEGGHLIVHRTPNLMQNIIGVEFKNFGNAGLFDRPVSILG
jgi:hypothetical protein